MDLALTIKIGLAVLVLITSSIISAKANSFVGAFVGAIPVVMITNYLVSSSPKDTLLFFSLFTLIVSVSGFIAYFTKVYLGIIVWLILVTLTIWYMLNNGKL